MREIEREARNESMMCAGISPKGKPNKHIYNPPAWRVCEECGGSGYKKTNAGPSVGSMKYGRKDVNCQHCNGTGRIEIRYTPDQWQKDGGILSDDTQGD